MLSKAPNLQSRNTDHAGQTHNRISAPSISFPKRGDGIHGICEKLAARLVSGTGSQTAPLHTSPDRPGFGWQLCRSYDSGAGKGPFGCRWSLALASITRTTYKASPQYADASRQASEVVCLFFGKSLV